MSLRILINTARSEEVRAAIVRDGALENLEIDTKQSHVTKGNVYKGVVANVEPSLNACFVEIGGSSQGFLPMDDIAPTCYHEKPQVSGRPRINEVIRRRREIVVQVSRDAIGNKGPALTTYASLAGRFAVLMPYDDTVGISRKLEDEKARRKLKDILAKLEVPDDFGFIVRTAGVRQTKTALDRDLKGLLKLWSRIHKDAVKAKGPTLLHEEGDLVVRTIRDYFTSEVDEIVVDTEEARERARSYFKAVMPRTRATITLHSERRPLFTHYRIEDQLETIHNRRVRLPSGGNIVIDPTEALISIDVNSARATREKSQEDTALRTNLESAREIARQLRLRNLGGLIVVDFIDMSSRKNNRAVEKEVKEAVKQDKARVYLCKISENGLMEINRQRIKQALRLTTHRDCPTCGGAGSIPAPEFLAMQILRQIDIRTSSTNLAEVRVDLHPELADALQNQFRAELLELEGENEIRVLICARPGMHRSEQQVTFKDRPKGSKRGGGGKNANEGAKRAKSDNGPGGRKGSQKRRSDNKGSDKPGSDNRGGDKAVGDDRGSDNRGSDNRGSDNRGSETKGEKSPAKKPAKPAQKPQRKGGRSAGKKDSAADKQMQLQNVPGDEGDDTPLTKSQKRRLRRKRKQERDRLEVSEGRSETQGDTEQQDLPLAGQGTPADEADGTLEESAKGDETEQPDSNRRKRSGRRGGRGRRGSGRGRKPAQEATAADDPQAEDDLGGEKGVGE